MTTTGATSLVFYNNLADAQNEINPIANTNVAPTTTSDYFVVSTSVENCKSAIETIKITVNSNPIITTSDTSICEGDTYRTSKFGYTNWCYEFGVFNNLSDAQNEIQSDCKYNR